VAQLPFRTPRTPRTFRTLRTSILLVFATILSNFASADPAVTFSKDIAPIVFAKCAMCHHPNGSAPFSLLTYASARSHATQIVEATRSGFMPPWKADAGVGGDFIGQEHLTDRELERIQEWTREGAPEGDVRELPPAPRFSEGWQLGKPDVILKPPAYTLAADGKDVFRIFVIPIPATALRFVRGLEFQPGNQRVVHHANIRIDETEASREFDSADPAPGYEGLIAHSAKYPDGHFLGWTPGQVAPLLPKGMAWRLNPGTDLVVELHMQPSGKPESVQPSIGLYFGADPPERTPVMLRLGRQTIDMTPGVRNYTISDSFVVPVDVEVQAVQPHAHYRAKEITGYATLPDGTNRPLIHIKDWDFRWQHVYRYVTPIALPKGTRLSMRYVYDNSADNPHNPDRPPQRVFWGQRSSDEMGDLWIQVLTRTERDLQTLENQFGPKVMAEDVLGYERWIQVEGQNVGLHDAVGVLYLKLNRASDAIRHFKISVQLGPDLPAAHFNLGTALTVDGQLDEATAEYRRALELKPDYARAHNNLAAILLQTGRGEEAIGHLEQALALDPANAEAHRNLGAGRQQQGRMTDAIAEYERAVALTGRADPAVLDALGAAYAAAGQFAKAIEAAEAALALNPPNASAIRERRDSYKTPRR